MSDHRQWSLIHVIGAIAAAGVVVMCIAAGVAKVNALPAPTPLTGTVMTLQQPHGAPPYVIVKLDDGRACAFTFSQYAGHPYHLYPSLHATFMVDLDTEDAQQQPVKPGSCDGSFRSFDASH